MYLQKKNFFISICICIFLFAIILFFFTATYHSNDDIYPLYILSGAKGSQPSNLLHYNHIIHPALGWVIASLFAINKSVNWFSFTLYFFQFCAWLNIFYLFLTKSKNEHNTLFCILLFFIFGAPLLLQLTFTDTSYLLYISAFLSILFNSFEDLTYSNLCIPGLFLTIGLFLRLHTLIPIAALSGSFILFSKKKPLLICFFIIVGINIFLINKIHTQYYSSRISNWDSEERYRHAILDYDNHYKKFDSVGVAPKMKLQEGWLANGILIDPDFIEKKSVDSIISRKSGCRNISTSEPEFKWFIINNRIFFGMIIFLLLYFTFITNPKKKETTIICVQVLSWICLHFVLILFLKMPSTFFIVTASFISLTLLYFIVQKRKIIKSGYWTIAIYGCLIFFFIWSFIRIYKISESNSLGRRKFLAAWEEISKNKDKLYLAPYDAFPSKDFGTFDNPSDFPIYNVMVKQDWMNNTYKPYYKLYNIQNSKDLLLKKNVRFLGNKNGYISDFAKMKYNLNGSFVPAPEKYKELHASIFVLTN